MQTASNRHAENLPVLVWNAGASRDGLAPSYFLSRLLFILMSNGTSCGRPRRAFAVVRRVYAHAWRGRGAGYA